jgi:hypothetical protein
MLGGVCNFKESGDKLHDAMIYTSVRQVSF